MAFLASQIARAPMDYPYSSVMRNYLDSHPLYATRQIEYGNGGEYYTAVILYDRESKKQLFHMKQQGKSKKRCLEFCYQQAYDFVSKWKTQGLDSNKDMPLNADVEDKISNVSKEENVIIEGAETNTQMMIPEPTLDAIHFATTEDPYEFTSGESSIIGRWMPMASQTIGGNQGPTENEGLIKSWKIFEDMANMDNINVLPLRGFMLGKYDMEFKLVLQTTPFQAMILMFGYCPNPYGLYTETKHIQGYTANKDQGDDTIYPITPIIIGGRSYLSIEASIQRPHVIMDVTQGGEASLMIPQKYQRTFVRTFDATKVEGGNPGVRGGFTGLLTLHALTGIQVGTGTANSFNARVFYRFSKVKVTAMTQPVVKLAKISTAYNLSVPEKSYKNNQMETSNSIAVERERAKYRAKWRVQGPALSIMIGAKVAADTASAVIRMVENLGGKRDRRIRNQDKPNDAVHQLATVPRPRMNFTTGEGVDSACVVGLNWVELSKFLEFYDDEPKSYKDMLNMFGFLGIVQWQASEIAGNTIWRWTAHPTDSARTVSNTLTAGLCLNDMNTPVQMISSGFSNYRGTLHIYAQFAKTFLHKGAIEVSITYARQLTGDAKENSYVKIINVQECSGFHITVPYIFDTPMRTIDGTSTPLLAPNVTWSNVASQFHSTIVTIRVLNQLIAPDSVAGNVPIVLYLKGGDDFVLNYPRPYNTTSAIDQGSEIIPPPHLVPFTSGPEIPRQWHYITNHKTDRVARFAEIGQWVNDVDYATQGDDFNEPNYSGNIFSSCEHLNFRSILKQPIKIVSNYAYKALFATKIPTTAGGASTQEVNYQAYICLPVAPLSRTFVTWLSRQMAGKQNYLGGLTQSHQYFVNTCYGQYSGGMMYTIIVDGTSPVYYAYAPYDRSGVSAFYGPLAQYQYRAAGSVASTLEPSKTSNFGVPIMGNSGSLEDLASAGLTNGIIIPSVNPTEKIEINQSIPQPWMLMNRDVLTDKGGNLKSARENSEWYNGKLYIWSNSDCKITIYQNNPDCFELGAFLGNPGFFNPYASYAIDDNRRKDLTAQYKAEGVKVEYYVQGPSLNCEMPYLETYSGLMEIRDLHKPVERHFVQGKDFRIKDLARAGWSSFKNFAMTGAFATSAAALCGVNEYPLEYWAGAIAIYSATGLTANLLEFRRVMNSEGPTMAQISEEIVGTINHQTTKVVDNMSDAVANAINGVVTDFRGVPEEMISAAAISIKETITDGTNMALMELKKIVDSFFPTVKCSVSLTKSLWGVAQHLIHCALAKTWSNAGFAVFGILVELDLVSMKCWKEVGPKIEAFYAQAQAFVTQGPGDNAWVSLMHLLAAIICGKMQVRSSGGLQSHLKRIFWGHDYRSVSGLNAILSLTKTMFQGISTIVDWAFKEADPQAKLLASLHNQGVELTEFAADANEFLTFFADQDFNKRDKRVKYLAVILRAIKIRETMIQINDHKIVGPLMRICTQVIEKANAMQFMMKCDIVKQEPFVFCLEGDPEVGKSFSIYYLIPYLLKHAKIMMNTPDYIFTINCALDYFNGLRNDHIAWWFDDVWNLKDIETVRKMCNVLYGVMTSAPYNVPRAELDNKEQLGQPILMGMTTNNPFVSHPDLPCPKAIWRRRHNLARLVLKEGTKKVSECTDDTLKNFAHLEVLVYGDVTDSSSRSDRRIPFSEYAEQLAEQFVKHLEREAKNQKIKYDYLSQCMTKNAIDMLNIGNPFDLLRQANTDCTFGESDSRKVLEEEVAMIVHEMNHRKVILSKIPEMTGEFEAQGPFKVPFQENTFVHDMLKRVQKYFARGAKECVRCLRCSEKAHNSGVALWCESGAHYLCLACASVKCQSEVISTLTCQLHESSKVRIEVVTVARAFFANVFEDQLGGNKIAGNFLSALFQGGDETTKTYITFIRHLRFCLEVLTKLSKMFTQGIEIGQDVKNWIDSKETTTHYYPIDAFAPSQHLQDRYIEFQNLGEIESEAPYICPHSMLMAKYLYTSGKFTILYDDSIVIPDLLCDGVKCVLSSVKVTMELKHQLQTSMVLIEAFNKHDVSSIKMHWPRFLWPKRMNIVYTEVSRVYQFLSTDWWVEYKSKNPIINKLITKVFPILIICGSIWAASKVANVLWKWVMSFIGMNAQDDPYDDEKAHKEKGRRKFYRTQGANFSNKLNKISGNYVRIITNGKSVTGWGLKGSTFLLPGHLVDFVTQLGGFELIAMKCTDKLKIKREHVEVTKVPRKDLIMVTITQGRILFSDCSKFLQKTPVNAIEGREAIIMEVDKEGVVDYAINITATTGVTSALDNQGRVYENAGGVMYPYQKVGLCGSLVCTDSITPILAMHISGSQAQDSGIGVVLYQDDFEVQGESLYEEDIEFCERVYGNDCCLQVVGCPPTDMQSFIPTDTDLVPSDIAVKLPPTVMMPAFLTMKPPYPHDKSPLYYGVRKNGLLAKSFDKSLMQKAYQIVKALMLSTNPIPNLEYKIFNAEEAVCGLNLNVESNGTVYFGHIPLDTSAGWPYTTNKWLTKVGSNLKNKHPWITVEYGEDGFPMRAILEPTLAADHMEKMQQRSNGEAAFNVFQDCLKDERRPIEKAYKCGGTRLFSMSNVEGSIALRRYTLALVNHLRYGRIKNGIAIGINPESMEWNSLAVTLQRHPNFFTLDFSNFGASLEYYTGLMFSDLILDFNKMYGMDTSQTTRNVVEALMRELMGSYHIAGSVIYKTFGGSPSGACITAEINSFVHLMYFAMCWLIIGEVNYEVKIGKCGVYSQKYPTINEYIRTVKPTRRSFSIEDFFANCVVVVYGDDGIYSVSNEYIDVFNAESIGLILAEHNLAVTNADKGAVLKAKCGFEECEFLKRKFVAHPFLDGFYASQMRWEVVEEMVKWIRRKPLTAEQATISNCESSLTFAFGHGEEKYNEWVRTLDCAIKSVYGKFTSVPQIDYIDLGRRMFPEILIEKF